MGSNFSSQSNQRVKKLILNGTVMSPVL